MSIKISQLANLTIAADTTSIPVIDYVANTLTTLQSNVSTLRTYFVSNLTTALNSNVSTLNASILAANIGMKGYVDQGNSIQSTIVTTSNTGMKGYVDGSIATVNASILAANVGMKGYVDAATSGENTAIASANVGMKGYVDQSNTIQSNQITSLISNAATQSDLIIGINANVTAANIGMLGYVNSQSFYSNAKVAAYLPTYSGNIGGLLMTQSSAILGNLLIGSAASTIPFGNVVINAVNNANSYVQLNIQNINSFGNLVSADFIATAPDGTDSSKYIDMGINGNNYSSSAWTVSGADDGYVYVNSGNLTLGTDTPGTTVKVHVGGTLAANIVATFSNTNLTVTGNISATSGNVWAKYVRTTPSTVTGLGYANVAGAGARAFVTDANTITFNSVVSGGAGNNMPVFSDGTNWRIG